MSATSSINGDGGGGGTEDREFSNAHVVELVEVSSRSSSSSDSITEDQTPLLTATTEKPKINIFSVSYPRRKSNKEQITRIAETDISPFTQFFIWAWGGSRYSGLLCMALSSSIYCIMEVISDIFSVQSIPLFEVTAIRCTTISVLSFLWLRRTGQPIFGPTNARTHLLSRAFLGYLSLSTFIYCIQKLPLSQAIMLSFTTPIMASLSARIILHEKLKISEIGGLACSFFGVLFIFRPMFTTQGWLGKATEANESYIQGSHHFIAVLIGLFSSITGGMSYCFVRAGAKAADQPVITVFSFGILASPAAIMCTLAFEDFVTPGLFSLFLMVALGILAFFAELFLSRGLQLEKTSKVANIQYIEVGLSQFWGMASFRVYPSFGRLAGCTLIFISACCTLIFGPDKDVE